MFLLHYNKDNKLYVYRLYTGELSNQLLAWVIDILKKTASQFGWLITFFHVLFSNVIHVNFSYFKSGDTYYIVHVDI